MSIHETILAGIGHTPLVRLNKMNKGFKAEIFVKAEFLNPGGSVKDRVALAMITAAEKSGALKPGGTIVEATAGNTGAGLALIAAVRGYRCIFVLPDKMSEDKINLLKAYGAEVVITPTSVPPDSPESYNGVADRLAREIPGAFRPNQFENQDNPLAHYRTTGPEIWEGTAGKLDIFVASMGTGGTISGTGKYLKEKDPDIVVVGADPEGSILSGDSPKPYKVEGIGEDFIPRTFNRQVVDEMIRVGDKESFNTARRLAREEGILAGGSSGCALAAALKYAQRLQTPKTIVVLLPDTGRNYIQKIYSDRWMKDNGFWQCRETRSSTAGDILKSKKSFTAMIYVKPKDTLTVVVEMFIKHNISQVPVIDNDQVVGSLNEASLMKLSHDGVVFSRQEASAVMGKPLPVLEEEVDAAEVYRVLLSGATGVVVRKGLSLKGLITRTDILNYWLRQKGGIHGV